MGVACNTHTGDKKSIHRIGRKIRREGAIWLGTSY